MRCRLKRINGIKGEMYFFTVLFCFSLLLFFLPMYEYMQTNYEITSTSKVLEARAEQYATVMSVLQYSEYKEREYSCSLNDEYIKALEDEVIEGSGFTKNGNEWHNERGVIITNITYSYDSSAGAVVNISYTVSMPYKVLNVILKNIEYNRSISVTLDNK